MKKRKGLLLILGFFVATSLSACSGSWYVKEADITIEKGIFTYCAVQAYDQAYQITNISSNQIWDEEIDGKPVTDWIKEQTIENIKTYIAIEEKFAEIALELTDEDKAEISERYENEWILNGLLEYYGKIGVSQYDYRAVVTNTVKKEKLLVYYSDKLSENISGEMMQSYLEENYSSFMFVSFAYTDEAGESNKEEYQRLCSKVKEKETTLEALIKEYLESSRTDVSTSAQSTEEGGRLDIAISRDSYKFVTDFKEQLFEADNGAILYFDDTTNHTYNIVKKTNIIGDNYFMDQEKENILVVLREQAFAELLGEFVAGYDYKINSANVNSTNYKELISATTTS